jgi:NurA-like 5'-3' nuclease
MNLVNYLTKIYIKRNVKCKILCSNTKIPAPNINIGLRRLLGEKISNSEVSSVQLKSLYRIWLHTVKRGISQVDFPVLLLLAS